MPLKPKTYDLILEDDVKSAFGELFPKALFFGAVCFVENASEK